jgi:hypothetical protein
MTTRFLKLAPTPLKITKVSAIPMKIPKIESLIASLISKSKVEKNELSEFFSQYSRQADYRWEMLDPDGR